MSGVNKVIIIGNLGNDPEMRAMPDGTAVANLSVATSESWKDKQTGERKEKTEWHRVVMFGRLAEIAQEYLSKGSKVFLEGSLHTRKWEDQQGNTKYSTEIKASHMQMLDGKGEAQEPHPARRQPAKQPVQQQAPEFQSFDDDIPF